ncbi:DUF6286 domain-containing protein [Streptomyces sp. NPDC046985]|uniref:DUF6286 domain-containing protein n=1 Tax=Streptomyces sp. NPDC046985 TaxID=3155377 RepID=UPI0033E05F37
MSEPPYSEHSTQPLPVLRVGDPSHPADGDMFHKPGAGMPGEPADGPPEHFDGPPEQADGPPEHPAARGRRGHRFWSARRAPAVVVALLVLVVAGAFLYDIASVRTGRTGLRWRRELARQLATRPLDDSWVLVGAVIAALLGLWLVVLALTPGQRGLLPMRRPHPGVRAALRRDAAALLLRDRAMEISGVRSVRVRLRRARAHVRAVAHFREVDAVRADLDLALSDAVRGLGLTRPPALSVRVQRPRNKG